MANLGQWYSGNNYAYNDGNYGYEIRAMVKVDLLSQDPATNTSVVRYTSAISHWLDAWKLTHTLYDVCNGVVLYNSPFQMDFPNAFGGRVTWYCIVRDRTITHNANGDASFNVSHQWGPTSVSASYTLPKINRQASITSVNDFTVESNTSMQISNPAGYWLSLEFWVWDGVDWEPRIFHKQIGQVSSYEVSFTSAEISAIYTQLGNATQGSGLFGLRTYTDAGYTNQLGDRVDRGVTLNVNTGLKEAYITNTPNFVIGNNVTLAIHNPRNYWLRLVVYLWNGTDYGGGVANIQLGQVSSYTTAFTEAQINLMYGRFKNLISGGAIFRIFTYSDSGYSNQVGNYRDRNATASVNTAINNPTFTNYDLISEDKAVTVKDSYNNTLDTTTTNTLTGSNQKVIQGVSQAKVSITSANKMVAKNQADPVRYRFVNGEKLVEASYKASETVNLLIDNITSKDAVVSAYDSRGLATAVTKSFTNIANYTPPTAWSLALVRDNNVDEKTKLSIGGKFWKQYFGGGTSGVQNTITAHYRYKETTASWGSQTWNTLAVTSNAEGDISFNDYINGDLGVNGFNKDKSYSIEVRFYDKISALIVSGTLNKGTPLLDWTIDGVAIKDKYNPEVGGSLQVDGENMMIKTAPTGAIIMYGGATAPDGWLLCDGSAVSRTTYAKLYAIYGTTFGEGNGSTTFNLPDFRGIFPKGAGTTSRTAGKDGAGNFYGATLGAYSTDKLQGHRHKFVMNGVDGAGADFGGTYTGTGGSGGIITSNQGAFSQFRVGDARTGGQGTLRQGTLTEPQNLGVNFIAKT